MLWLRFACARRKFNDTEWRIIGVRVKRPIPFVGSVGVRAVRRLTPLPPERPEVAKILIALDRRRRLGRWIGFVALLVILVAVWMALGARSFECLQTPCLPNGFRGHVAALEFARTKNDVAAIVGDLRSSNRLVMKRELSRDFVFIALYLALYLLLSALLARALTSFSPLLRAIAVVAAFCAAGFDVLENVRALRVLDVPLANLDDATVASILDAAVIKWTFSFVTIAILSLAFRYGDRINRSLRALFLLTAAAGVVGLISHPLIQLNAFPLLLGLLILIVIGLFRPLRLVRDS